MQTFSSTQPINVPGGTPGVTQSPGLPYASAIAVSGLANGTITDVKLTIDNLSHTYVEDVDVLLSSGDRWALVMSDVGSSNQVESLTLTLDDEAAAALPDGLLSTGSYRPANLVAGDVGTISGWSLEITAEVDVEVPDVAATVQEQHVRQKH